MWVSYRNSKQSVRFVSKTLEKIEGELANPELVNGSSEYNAIKNCLDKAKGGKKVVEGYIEDLKGTSDTLKKFINDLKLSDSERRNEVLLFHGAKGAGAKDNSGEDRFSHGTGSPVDEIREQGFDERLGPEDG